MLGWFLHILTSELHRGTVGDCWLTWPNPTKENATDKAAWTYGGIVLKLMAQPCLIYQCKHALIAPVAQQMLFLVLTFAWQSHISFSCVLKVRGSCLTLLSGASRKHYIEKQICAIWRPTGHYLHTSSIFASPDWLTRWSHACEADFPKRLNSSILWTPSLRHSICEMTRMHIGTNRNRGTFSKGCLQ